MSVMWREEHLSISLLLVIVAVLPVLADDARSGLSEGRRKTLTLPGPNQDGCL